MQEAALDSAQAAGPEPLGELPRQILRQRMRQAGALAADFLADGIPVFLVSLGEQDGDLVGGEEQAAEVMALAARSTSRMSRILGSIE